MKPTLLCAILIALLNQTNAQVIFVNSQSNGDGTSWANAMSDLSKALHSATYGTQIWVAEGIYHPTFSNDRKASFFMKDGVQLFGGFAGNEASINDRKVELHPTVLSGEIGNMGIQDNTYSVIQLSGASESTVIDGFVITGGNANGDVDEAGKSRCGGGMYIDGAQKICKPTIRKCTFKANYARDGAAVYNNGRNGESSPTFIDCLFSGNEAGLDGGAIYNDGRLGGKSNPTLTNCHFERNMGTYGGAICNATETGICNLTLENCSFIENAAYLRGGAVFNMNGDEQCQLEISDCQFKGNFPDDQDMIFTSSQARAQVFKVMRSEP